jgi:hypothetical protein
LNPKSGQPITPGEKAIMETMVPDLSRGIDVLQPLSHGERVPTPAVRLSASIQRASRSSPAIG